MKKIVISSLCIAILTACVQQPQEPTLAADVQSNRSLTQLNSGIDLENFDHSIRPQDNFYLYVNGNWLNKTDIPADRTSVGAFHTLRENARDDVLKIIEDVASQQDLQPGSNEQKVAALYRSYMDEATIEKLGIAPLKQTLADIDAINTPSQLVEYFATSQIAGINVPLIFYVTVDAKVATQYRSHFWQGGLSLPDKDYYLDQDAKFAQLRQGLTEHITTMFRLAEFADPAASAATIMRIETQIAEHHWSKTAVRDSTKRYNKYSVNTLDQLSTDINWDKYFRALKVHQETEVIINQPSYVKALGTMIQQLPLDDWKTYLRWMALNSRASYLNQAFADENFAFFDKTLKGQQAQKPRWKRAVDQVSSTLGEVIGELYVERHFKPEAKTRMVELVENLRKAYGISIDQLDWMSDNTKIAAKDKLAKFIPKIGYPNLWRDYSSLTIEADQLVNNITNAYQVEHERSIGKLGGPIDREEWGMTPQTVNAYYMPTKNEIVFPAAILQPPFFNMAADDAVNYGGIGAVIGHEMGHGFDDQGSKYDGDGNLRNWWTKEDLAEFTNRTKALIEQYNNYQVFDDLNVNGELTLGENIGDLAGVTIAYKAYKLSLNGKEAPIIDGLTGDQRFFIGFTQIWQGKYKEETMRNRVSNDPHSPGNFRALGALSNMPQFYEAFNVQPGDEMYISPEKRVKIW